MRIRVGTNTGTNTGTNIGIKCWNGMWELRNMTNVDIFMSVCIACYYIFMYISFVIKTAE